ncbi:hypothetical protein [Halomonas salipaludis]|uniref:Ferric oxidoreductase domain-containing protein n=1 Tax=Halomonas salipaludis TaxID=2032625 RepID=A0A2A2EX73_9GAMM|nr:hypothetical protein [Halomonas salipaludis]PAU77278.1 hypothetical protein CK498_08530 [Halomonas salipaludis]
MLEKKRMSQHPPPGQKRMGKAFEASAEATTSVGKYRLLKHLAVVLIGAVVTYLFWASRLEWDNEMRTWRAFGDAAFTLLFVALSIGPVARLWPKVMVSLMHWRRAFGIWFALYAAVHAYLVWDGWARWSISGFLGYQHIDNIGIPGPVLVDPGFGLANLIGLVALFWALVLMAISSDRAIRYLGSRAWKHLQQYAYVIFYLVALHASYFLFLHYELSLRNLAFQRGVPDPNWFRFWFLGLVGILFVLQTAAMIKTFRHRRGRA